MALVPWQEYLQRRQAFKEALSRQDPWIVERCKTLKIDLNRIASRIVSEQILEEWRVQQISDLRTDLRQLGDRLKHKKRRAEVALARAKTVEEKARILAEYLAPASIANESPAKAQRMRERLQAKTQAKSQVEIDDSFRRANSDAAGRFLGQKRTTPFKFLKPAEGLSGRILMGRPPDVVPNRLSEFLHHHFSQFPGLSIKDRDKMVETFLHVGRLTSRARSATGSESFARRQRRIRHTSRR
jgi:hypothetical protein